MGKLERLHRTLKAEGRRFSHFESAQAGLDTWRRHDNYDRPREPRRGPRKKSRAAEASLPVILHAPRAASPIGDDTRHRAPSVREDRIEPWTDQRRRRR
jgi:hypothetical protein